MTIIVGIKCAGGIVVASDSQTTRGHAKRLDTHKLDIIKFRNLDVLVAQAGCTISSHRAIEILQSLACDTQVTDYRTVGEIAQKAMRGVKEELRSQNLDCSSEALHSIIETRDLDCELMLAFYFKMKPYVFTINLQFGIANKEDGWFSAIGCGALVAEYILGWFNFADMTPQQGMIAAVYVVEEVKRVDPYCGGPPRLGLVYSDKSGLQPDSTVDLILTKLKPLQSAASREWSDKTQKIIDDLAQGS